MTLGWVLLALIYLTGLFWIARWGDRNTPLARAITSHPIVYSLALAIYCSAWTFFGMVGEASRNQWQYIAILLGPILVYLFGYRFIYKLILVSKRQNITTIADFIASRYGKRQTVALLVTFIALLATIPYMALQLKAIGSAFQLITEQQHSEVIVLIASVFIAFFAIYFGTQHSDVTEYRRGLMLAIAFESSIKLIALIVIASLAYVWAVVDNPEEFSKALSKFNSAAQFSTLPFFAQTLMSAAAIICLPRQFHVAVVDNLKLSHLKTARFLFPLYLAVTAAVIPIITAAGQTLIGAQEPDTYVLSLAILSDSLFVKILVFMGGLSAAMAMIIIATLTLSTMVTNDVILPKMLSRQNHNAPLFNYAKTILLVRRLVIATLIALAYFYHQQMTGSRSLLSIGLVAFSLVVQLLPAILGGLYWKKGHAHGVYAGLLAGFLTWVMWLMFPMLNEVTTSQLQSEVISVAAMVSLFANTSCYLLFSHFAQDRLVDRIQSQAFVSPREENIEESQKQRKSATIGDLSTLLSTFLGESRVKILMEDFENRAKIKLHDQQSPDHEFLQYCERALGGALGASSAKALIDSALGGKKLDFEEVVNFFDDTTQAMQFNTTALFTSIESLDQGISVIDKNLNMVAWNRRYLELFNYPADLVNVGTPIEDLVRYNAQRGECGVGEIESLVQKRVAHLKAGHPHKFIRQRSDGKMIEMVGNPLPGGGFVTSFNDITAHIEIQKALEESKINLERRIEKRGEEVQAINAELRSEIERRAQLEEDLVQARKAAEDANASKTRFLALASHDVLQPLNAAKLYLSALGEIDVDREAKEILNKLSDSVNSSETLIATLLDIARLDQGEMKLTMEDVLLPELLSSLIDEFAMKAEQKGLQLRTQIPAYWVNTDKTHLYRIVQNLLSNAVKYTKKGKILLSARKRQGRILIQVWDTGIGISAAEQNRIFNDFYRVDGSPQHGVGLGLGVVTRMSSKLAINVSVRSTPNKGSCFSFDLPLGESHSQQPDTVTTNKTGLKDMLVLCIDDKDENLDAMQTVLSKWQVNIITALDLPQAKVQLNSRIPDVILVDYHLTNNVNGLDVIEALRNQFGENLHAVLVTANQQTEIVDLCKKLNISYLSKPVKPAKLRALLNSFRLSISPQ
ncbi:PAS domain-containing hybrid sensor histidine kinase/response regulator [Aliiglaciecola sp. 3_MG-2023]|uniref:PAS domain-containing hybrid sensor histidine kinase/response regulator n=1 Tax=Aliiglaciecola sp. 3_MG-2023 TaxID=3062644 RepID=UPI0026E3CD32|nr:PAS domain-containing hybrid sensor histidine kinase/response regulator [Aliiglaciecola sp. 3_MG-2023]MDO6692963.1 PAS domain-containing hybrid sensor histidine kinase/response regulator [Aliiglaciecola sp. 3_MG-2023]